MDASTIKTKLLPCVLAVCIMAIGCKDECYDCLDRCCESPPLIGSVGNATIVLPNYFTPNSDGLNDQLYVLGDSISRIILFQIKDQKDHIVFEREDIALYASNAAWDGKTDGSIRKGMYEIFVEVESEDGIRGSFETSVCNYPCQGIEQGELIYRDQCFSGDAWLCWRLQLTHCIDIDRLECIH